MSWDKKISPHDGLKLTDRFLFCLSSPHDPLSSRFDYTNKRSFCKVQFFVLKKPYCICFAWQI